MPLPHYIIAAQERSEDKTTGLVSFFSILESIIYVSDRIDIPDEELDEHRRQMFVVSSWMRTDDESPDQEYEGEWFLSAPGIAERVMMHNYTFTIPQRTYRFSLNTGLSVQHPGIFTIENRIRRKGTSDEWISLRYPLHVSIPKSSSEKKANPKNPGLACPD